MMLHAALTAGFAVGAISLAYFLSLVTGIPMAVWELLFLAGGGAWWWRLRRAAPPAAPVGRTGFEWLLIAAFALLFVAAIYTYWMEYSRAPGGSWDAWAIWNLRARFLFRAGANWRDAFSPVLLWSHPDYPLLVPAFVAGLWTQTGGESTWVPGLAGLLFTLSTPLLLASAVGALRGREAGWLAGIFLLGRPLFVTHGASQYADVPVAFFMVAAMALLALDRPVTAGVCAGLAAWTKNEGLLFVAVLLVARIAALLYARDAARLRREVPRFAAGLAPVLAVVLYFRGTLATANANLAGGAIDFGRIPTVAAAFVTHLFGVGQLLVSPFLFLALYVWLAKPVRTPGPGALTALIALVLMLAGDAAVYVVTPGDVNWFIDNSLDRVLLQVWPLAIFAAFLYASAASSARSSRPV